MSDPNAYKLESNKLECPALNAEMVTPSDAADLPNVARALYIGGPGDIAVITAGGSTVTFNGVVAGTILPVRVKRVMSTGTSAGNLVALY